MDSAIAHAFYHFNLTPSEPCMSPTRFSQADYEARVTLLLYAAFFLWWTIGAFGLGDYAQTPIWGMPAWFFVSCVLGYPLICVALWITVRLCFKDMPLDGHLGKDEKQACPPNISAPECSHD